MTDLGAEHDHLWFLAQSEAAMDRLELSRAGKILVAARASISSASRAAPIVSWAFNLQLARLLDELGYPTQATNHIGRARTASFHPDLVGEWEIAGAAAVPILRRAGRPNQAAT